MSQDGHGDGLRGERAGGPATEGPWTPDEKDAVLGRLLGDQEGEGAVWRAHRGEDPAVKARRRRASCLGCLTVVLIVGLAGALLDDSGAYCRLCGRRRHTWLIALPGGREIPIRSRTHATPLSDLLDPLFAGPHGHSWVVEFRPIGFGGFWSALSRGGGHGLRILDGLGRHFRVLRWLAPYDPELTLAIAQALLEPDGSVNENERLDQVMWAHEWFMAGLPDAADALPLTVKAIDDVRREYGLGPAPELVRKRIEAAYPDNENGPPG